MQTHFRQEKRSQMNQMISVNHSVINLEPLKGWIHMHWFFSALVSVLDGTCCKV